MKAAGYMCGAILQASRSVPFWGTRWSPSSSTSNDLPDRTSGVRIPCWPRPLPQSKASLKWGCQLEWLLCRSYIVVALPLATLVAPLCFWRSLSLGQGQSASCRLSQGSELEPPPEIRAGSWGVSSDTACVQRAEIVGPCVVLTQAL